MRKSLPRNSVVALALLTFLAVTGCKQEQAPTPAAKGSTPAVEPSAERTSFAQVTSQLDPGGNLYLYLSTEQCLAGLSGQDRRLARPPRRHPQHQRSGPPESRPRLRPRHQPHPAERHRRRQRPRPELHCPRNELLPLQTGPAPLPGQRLGLPLEHVRPEAPRPRRPQPPPCQHRPGRLHRSRRATALVHHREASRPIRLPAGRATCSTSCRRASSKPPASSGAASSPRSAASSASPSCSTTPK